MHLDPISSTVFLCALTLVVGGLALTLTQAASGFIATWRTRRYFRLLVALTSREPDQSSRYQELVAPLALAAGFEFVGAYRASGRTRRRMRVELWRAATNQTLALVTSERLRWGRHHHTELISVLDNGDRVTTCDAALDGDPASLRGETIARKRGFRELYALHLARVQASGRSPEAFGASQPVSVLEDLERARVHQLAVDGLARYRDPAQTAWSYTFLGACCVYYGRRPGRTRAALPGQPAATSTAE